jgi:hypothetical protein
MIIEKKIFVLIILFFAINSYPQSDASFQIARLKYSGGGDWYNDPSADINLLISLLMKYFPIHFCL